MINFVSIGHFFATVGSDLVKAGKVAARALQKAQAAEATVEAITAVVAPQFVEVERGAFAVFGLAMEAVEGAGDAAGANGLSVQLDQALVADLKALLPALKQFGGHFGLTAPAKK